MNKQLPDKWVRKAVSELLDGITVDGNLINCFDTRVSNNNLNYYILMSTQTNQVSKTNKCEHFYESSILIDVVTKYNGSGNVGSRLLADNIMDKVRELTNNLTLDVISGLVVLRQNQDFPNDITTITENQNVFRKFMRLELTIN